ncbi:MAG: hypothetical protein ING75_03675 [Rhodocyclaceae bacterium]|nr:hypothetical protein [Rhodocyclaceae bacterium]
MTTKLLFRTSPFNGGLVFATVDRARFVSKLHAAISSSKTWGEFRAAMPAEEYSSILADAFDEVGERRPTSSSLFLSEQVPGVSDGDYPPWLQAEMETVLPLDILERFGERKSTYLNGDYWFIPSENKDAVVEALAGMGIWAEEAIDLEFH